MEKENLEFWLAGPVDGVPDLMQPIVHALLQVQKEGHQLLSTFDESLLWEMPANVASVAFHLQHMVGVLDRLFTYADGQELSESQLIYLKTEGVVIESSLKNLLNALDVQIRKSIDYVKKIDPFTLTDIRYVGRKRIPSTVIGLIFHATEHTTRHFGQMSVTAKVLMA